MNTTKNKTYQKPKTRSVPITLLLFVLAPLILWAENNYNFHDVTEGYNLSNIGFVTVCEDEHGFLWCGGFNGLFFHNTETIKKVDLFSLETKEPIRVTSIEKDDNNDIWICSNWGLIMYNKTRGTFELKAILYPEARENNNPQINHIVQLNKHIYLLYRPFSVWVYNALDNTVQKSPDIISARISYLNKDDNGNIFIGTQDGRVYELQDRIENIKQIYQSTQGRISSICKDGTKYYLGTKNNGITIINSNGVIIDRLNSQQNGNKYLKNDYISQIIRRNNGEVWIGTNEGIYVLKNNKLTLLDSKLENGLPHRRVYSMHQGLDDKVWISTYSGGIAFYSKYNYRFKHILLDYPQKDLDKRHVATICEDKRGFIWIGNEDEGGIKVYDPVKKQFAQEESTTLLAQMKDVKTIVNISDEHLAIGRSSSNKMKVYNYLTGTLENDILLPLDAQPGPRGAHYNNGTLWVNDPREIVAYNIKTQKVELTLKCPSRIWQLYFDSSQNLWVCTLKGLYKLRPGSKKLELCIAKPASEILSSTSIYSVCEDRDGAIWVGTTGHGLYIYHPESKSIKPAPDYELSSSADIYTLIVDKQNDIWYTTNEGLFHYSIEHQKTDNYGTNKGTLNAENRLNASYHSVSGKLYFGSKSGFTIIDPSTIRKNTTAPSVFLANFSVNNHPYESDDKHYQNRLGINKLKKVTLRANENTLGFKVVSNNFIKSERNRYKYRLLNYEDSWANTSHDKDIVFTKVPPGKYIFEAYGSNNDLVWSSKPYRLEIVILPPTLLRWYALLSYLILLALLSWWIYHEVATKVKLHKEIERTENKTKINELIHSERIKLFTNISHELRTPLSLIVSPISHILNKDTIDLETKQLLQVVDRNTKRLQKMADQTIDFRLLEVGKLEPSFKNYELIQLTKSVFACFEQQFIDQQIKSSFSSDFKTLEAVLDGDMIEKIIFNLLSNALKYTPEKREISLHISQKQLKERDYKNAVYSGNPFVGLAISISIKDTGIGIKSTLLPQIFERFTKGELSHQTSTGIGLHLCSEYAKMNNANLLLISKEGKGTSFTLHLPMDTNTSYEKSQLKELVKTEPNFPEPELDTKFNKHTLNSSLLIVEDNGELRDFLKVFLSAYYKVFTAKNAEQALKQLGHFQPDLILTDVSLPGMSGIELCQQLKQDAKYKHIPIIIMTAFADRKVQMESILSGANAFFTKPIDQSLLLAQIKNTLHQRSQSSTPKKEPKVEDRNSSFIQRAVKIVERNLQNPDFQIADLLNELQVSKSTLTRKLKAELYQNASGFIRDIRLENAKKLITNKQFNIDEVSTFVGFNYTSYFIKSFKEKYGLTPSEYRKEVKKRSLHV